ncbi:MULTISPECIES: hypothetical protein [Bacillus cereus group]|uniref:hypothetical protein n=1 Tax=Bacillus cereus group TaxID=86661 RepID=UPI000BFDE541|nr:hypothetical protein [Bacillus toyonensis]PHB34486.1 hypothetical protein COE86_17605 [Bacillus toyonensis]
MSNKLDSNYLLLHLGLYDPIEFDETHVRTLETMFNSPENLQFDCYCTQCKKESTFKYSEIRGYTRALSPNSFIAKAKLNSYSVPINLMFTCQRDALHIYTFSFRITDDKITKIGQFPSIASLEVHTIDKYRKILSDDYRDFSKAIGLYSHGIGAGSFVYLRRIFENLIEECRLKAQKDSSFNDTDFQGSKMDQKILMLKSYLPNFLVENRKLYGILSKGIHELDEKTCLELFPNVQIAIELILDEKIHQLEKESKVQSARRFIAATVEKYKK